MKRKKASKGVKESDELNYFFIFLGGCVTSTLICGTSLLLQNAIESLQPLIIATISASNLI